MFQAASIGSFRPTSVRPPGDTPFCCAVPPTGLQSGRREERPAGGPLSIRQGGKHVKRIVAALIAVALVAVSALAEPVAIEFWHAMGGKNGEITAKVCENFNATQTDYKVVAVLQGLLRRHDERRHRRVPRGQRAPHHAGVRGRHRDDDVRQGRHQAGAGDDEGGRREPSTPRPTCPTITGYYSTAKGEMLSFPFNSSSTVVWVQQGRASKKAGLIAEKPPKTWPEVFEAGKKLKAAGWDKCGVHDRLVTWALARAVLGLAQRADGHQGQRHRRLRHRAQVQQPAAVKHLTDLVATCRRTRPTTTPAATNKDEGSLHLGRVPDHADVVGLVYGT